MMRFGKLSTEYLRWKKNAEAIKAANWRAVERYGVEPTTDEEWTALRQRLRRDQIAEILGKPLPAPSPTAQRAARWEPVTDDGKEALRLLGVLNAGLTVARRSAGADLCEDLEAMRDLLAQIDECVRDLDRAVAL
jgi:hypothetical protein